MDMLFLASLTNCSDLKELDLSNNKFSGAWPPPISVFLTNLSYLILSNNIIDRNIPPVIETYLYLLTILAA